MVSEATLLNELKTALRLKGSTIAEFSRGLRNPEGKSITRNMIYVAIDANGPDWLIDEIKSEIRRSKDVHPEYWAKHS